MSSKENILGIPNNFDLKCCSSLLDANFLFLKTTGALGLKTTGALGLKSTEEKHHENLSYGYVVA